MVSTDIASALQSPLFQQQWNDCSRQFPNLPYEQSLAATRRIGELREQFLNAAAHVTDPDQFQTMTALMYVQARSQWELIQTQIAGQHEHNPTNPEFLYLSSLLCVLIKSLEALLAPATAASLTAVLANPAAAADYRWIEIEFGTVFAPEIIAQARQWKDELANLTSCLAEKTAQCELKTGELQAQIAALTAENLRMQSNQTNLRRELGVWESGAIAEIVRSARDAVAQLGDRMLALETNQAVLERELGASDGEQIAAMMRKLSAENAALRDVADLFGAMEEDLKTLEVH